MTCVLRSNPLDGEKDAFQSLAFLGPVTSLRFLTEDWLLIGTGPYLRCFDTQTERYLFNINILGSTRIHGLALVENSDRTRWTVAVYGAKSLRIVELSRTPGPLLNSPLSVSIPAPIYQFEDWIHDTQWLFAPNSDEPVELALAFAHNYVSIYSVQDLAGKPVYRIQCSVQAIIYAARFFGHARSTLRLASGTVFNQVLIWRILSNTHLSIPEGPPVEYILAGHEGVIFGMRFSADGSIVTSVSDDRTVRVWRLPSADDPHKLSKPVQPVTLFGHTARVWDCLILSDLLVSISEDSTCRVWSFDPNQFQAEDQEPRSLACWRGHLGKSIWGVAVDPTQSWVATGGGDGGIRLWSLASVRQRLVGADSADYQQAPIELPALATYQTTPHDVRTLRPDFIRNFTYVPDRAMVVASHYGYLLHYSYITRLWSLVAYEPEIAGYAMLASSRDGRVVVCGTIQGTALVYYRQDSQDSHWNVLRLPVVPGQQIFDLNVQTSSNDPTQIDIFALVLNQPAQWLRLNLSSPATLTLMAHVILPSNTLPISFALDYTTGLLLLGSRQGALVVYSLPSALRPESIDRCSTAKDPKTVLQLRPCLNIRRLHGKDAVTSVFIAPHDANSSTSTTAVVEGDTVDSDMSDGEDLPEDESKTTATTPGSRWVTVYSGGRDGAVRQLRLRTGPLTNMPDHQRASASQPTPDSAEPWTTVVLNLASPVQRIECPLCPKLASDISPGSPCHYLELILEHRTKITKGWIEGLVLLDQQLLASVFYRRRFTVYNYTHQYDQLSVNCGGAHRRWYFHTADARLDRAVFLFFRRDAIHAYFTATPATKTESGVATTRRPALIQEGGHGREIRCLAFAPARKGELPLVASGGEDGQLRISQIDSHRSASTPVVNAVPLFQVKRHSSVLKCLAWNQVGDDRYLFTAGGCEELRCWQVTSKTPQLCGRDGNSDTALHSSLNCLEMAIATTGPDNGVRIMDISVLQLPKSANSSTSSSLAYQLIAAVYSDATVRLWACIPAQQRMFLIAHEPRRYHTHCPLAVESITVPSRVKPGQDKHWLLTGSTDGLIRVFDVSTCVEAILLNVHSHTSGTTPTSSEDPVPLVMEAPMLTIPSHQSGVNTLRVVQYTEASATSETRLLIASGGDDNQLALTLLNTGTATSDLPEVAAISRTSNAHASSITGLEMINPKHIVTTSTDQRMILWTWQEVGSRGHTTLQTSIVQSCLSNVVDPCAITHQITDEKNGAKVIFAIAGIGLEILVSPSPQSGKQLAAPL
ncbi:WD repeat-containing protein 6 [Dimargaris cristalligena]|uniref:WD40-repeat-containing domain protein n=1 Tax=Dimargaris cristalligena TaxID=215637 RepID=A0A4P9ZWH0_9FUNG|nr:WD repeat-containing protein 6 [Dimargaris cristalligena]RKP37953.1 WD40-repeat-containing domain protein [Dimargaris cristalligena]|eukprot:RKP37953.1 WD40-repeat-containing domain protein [Dimargaris cristalligena]